MQLSIARLASPVPLLRVAQFNAENVFDTEDDPGRRADAVEPEVYETRLAKLALTIRDTCRAPT